MTHRLTVIVLAVLLAAGLALADAGAPMVPERVTVQGEAVTLAHLVQAAGVKAGDHLRQIVLVKAPKPGGRRTLNGAYVRRQLAAAGLEFVAAPDRIIIERPGFAIDPTIGRQAVIDFIKSNAPWPEDSYRIEVVRSHMPLTVEPGAITARIIQHPKGRLSGTHTFVVEYRESGRRVARGAFTMRIHVQGVVYVAAYQLNRGVLLSERDLIAKEVDLAKIRGLPETDKSKLIGARIKYTVREGQIVTSGALEPVPVVRRGDAVVVIARRGGMAVTAFGVARESGALGEVIRVENMQSKRVVHARIENSNTVAVLF